LLKISTTAPSHSAAYAASSPAGPHPDPSSYAGKFSGSYSHRTIEGGVGHNLPQEAPEAFADAVLAVGGAT